MATAKKATKKKIIKKKATTKRPTAKKTAAKKTRPSIEFQIQAAGPREIFLAGDFNDWDSGSKDFRLRKYKGDIWKKKVKLKPGRYEYQFVVDGSWWTDPENPDRAKTPYHTENSVINVD